VNGAPLGLRFRAALIDAAAIIVIVTVGVCLLDPLVRLWTSAMAALGREPRDPAERDRRQLARRVARDRAEAATFGFSPRWRYAWAIALSNLRLSGRYWGALGAQRYALRRVDANTGGRISARSAMLSYWFEILSAQIGKNLLSSRWKPHRDRGRALEPQLRAVKRRYPDDPVARYAAVKRFNETLGLHPLREIGWKLASRIAWSLILALAIRDRRTVHDRISGTYVIVEERSAVSR
jgi:hypothetical protein